LPVICGCSPKIQSDGRSCWLQRSPRESYPNSCIWIDCCVSERFERTA
jgi:hypothetical protein